MKKIISITFCLIIICFVLTGCSNDSTPFEERNYTSDTQVSGINIDVKDRKVKVALSGDNQVHIQYFENNKEFFDISISDKNVLNMTSVTDKNWKDYIGKKPSAEYRKILLQIPNSLLETLTLSTTNESISISTLAVTKNVSITSIGGNITFDKLDIGNTLLLEVKNGNINGTILGSYDDFIIRSEIKKGDSNLPTNKENGEKTLSVSCNNGKVNINFVNK